MAVAAQHYRATAHVTVVDGLEAFALPALGSNLEPRQVDVRQRAQELLSLAPVCEAELARKVRTTDANRRRIEIEPEQIRGGFGRSKELLGAEQTLVSLAEEQSREPTLDRDEPVRIGADRDPVRRATKLAACMKSRVAECQLAPRFRRRAKQAEGKAQESWGETKDKADDVLDDAKDKADDVLDAAKDKLGDLQDKLDGDDDEDVARGSDERSTDRPV